MPIKPPARIGDWKEGGSFSIVVAHPAGTALIQGSAGFVENALEGVAADVVYLGIGGLGLLGEEHAAAYFEEIVAATGARCAVPIHWDDFTQPSRYNTIGRVHRRRLGKSGAAAGQEIS